MQSAASISVTVTRSALRSALYDRVGTVLATDIGLEQLGRAIDGPGTVAGGAALGSRTSPAEVQRAREVLSQVRALALERAAIREQQPELRSIRAKRKAKARVSGITSEIVAHLRSMHLNDRWVRAAFSEMMEVVLRIENAEADLAFAAERVAMPVGCLRRIVVVARQNPTSREQIARSLHLSAEGLRAVEDDLQRCTRRMLKITEDRAGSIGDLHRIGRAIEYVEAHRNSYALRADQGNDGPTHSTVDFEALTRAIETFHATGRLPRAILSAAVPAAVSESLASVAFARLAESGIDVLALWPLPRALGDDLRALATTSDAPVPIHLTNWRHNTADHVASLDEASPSTPEARLRLRSANGSRARAPSISVREVESRLIRNPGDIRFSTAIPQATSRSERRWQPRRVPLLAKSAESPSVQPEPSTEDTFTDLGRLGEGLVLSMMLDRWAAAARRDKSCVRALLTGIAKEYYAGDSTGDQVASELDRIRPGEWFDQTPIQRLLWPSQTAYGDAIGFDVFGLDDDSRGWLCVEVKTTQGTPSSPFQLTANEFARAQHEGNRYAIARVAKIQTDHPTVHIWRDPVGLAEKRMIVLTPESYVVSFRRTDG